MSLARIQSQPCTSTQFDEKRYAIWCAKMKEVPRKHRKQWEFVYILEALHQHHLLQKGCRGLGFGVGKEPLSAVMASLGVSVVATDMSVEKAGDWATSNQHVQNTAGLNERKICPAENEHLLQYRVVDMNDIPNDLTSFDFNWSSCAFEHLGSIEKGLRFIEMCLDTLKPGGVAVHTTEYNVYSNTETIDHEGTVLFRKRDFEELQRRL